MRPSAHLLAAAVVSFAGLAAPASGTPPTDAQIDAWIAAVKGAGEDAADAAAKYKAKADAVNEGMKDISWGEVSASQLDRLASKGLMRPYPAVCKAAFGRLKELAAEPTVEGARCADILMAVWPRNPAADADEREADTKAKADALAAAFKNPGTRGLFASGKGSGLVNGLAGLPPETVRERGLVDALEPYITTDLSPLTASALGRVFDMVMSEDFGATPEAAKRLREKIAAAALAASKKDEPLMADDPKATARLQRNLKDLAATCNSAWARGELMNHEAPPITFTWSNSEKPLHSFADLKGNVVVVDFWATWCGPCVASFPHMRELVEHYKGYPVRVIGVTSDQGFHIARSNEKGAKSERIDCADDPAKEHGLMTGFIKDMDMTWTVAFSEQNVFNPDFGVRGIPHIAIIDPAGKVRYNELRPGRLASETEKIDGLLKEFKLPTPAAGEPKKAGGEK